MQRWVKDKQVTAGVMVGAALSWCHGKARFERAIAATHVTVAARCRGVATQLR